MCMEILNHTTAVSRSVNNHTGMSAQEEAGRRAGRQARGLLLLKAVWFQLRSDPDREKVGVHQRSVDFIQKVEI